MGGVLGKIKRLLAFLAFSLGVGRFGDALGGPAYVQESMIKNQSFGGRYRIDNGRVVMSVLVELVWSIEVGIDASYDSEWKFITLFSP